mgnify:FL=1
MPSFWSGFSEGITEGIDKLKEDDRSRALVLLKGLVEGNVIPKDVVSNVTDTETQAPQLGVGRRIMSGLGIAPSAEADISRYRINPMNQAEKELEGKTKTADIAYKEAQTRHLQETTPSYIAEKQANIDNARQNIELRKQQIANDVTKTAQQKQIETQKLDLEKNKLDLEERKFNHFIRAEIAVLN